MDRILESQKEKKNYKNKENKDKLDKLVEDSTTMDTISTKGNIYRECYRG